MIGVIIIIIITTMSKLSNALERFKQRQLSLSKSLIDDDVQKKEDAKLQKRQQYEHQPPPPPPPSSRLKSNNNNRKTIDPKDLPMGYKIKQVLDFLAVCQEVDTPTPTAATVAMIRDGCGRDLEKERDLQKALTCNVKIVYDAVSGTYMYRRDTSVHNKDQLLRHIQTSERPVSLSELADAYPSVWADLRVLQDERLIYQVLDVFVANDVEMKEILPVDRDVWKLWMSCSLPADDTGMAAALRACGMEPTPRKVGSFPSSQKKKKKKKM